MKQEAILLLGPTGSGKTPLGDALERHGLFNRNCFHFDFGAHLRTAAAQGGKGLSPDDVSFIGRVLKGGALLEDETFYIARTLLENYITETGVGAEDLIVLNGLPRHAGQSRDVGEALHVISVVSLECSAETVLKRIAMNSGGDRTERTDDSVGEIARKLEIYAARTRPLLDYYRSAGVPCHPVIIGTDTHPDGILAELNSLQP